MAELADFVPSLSFFDGVYGDVMILIPISLDSSFVAVTGAAGARYRGSCMCTVGDGGWCQNPPGSGEEWIQRPLVSDKAPDFFLT